MSCSEREPCFVRYELTKTRCAVYETVRSLCQHSLQFRWMEKEELILVAQSMWLWLTIGHFQAKAKCSCIKYKQESWVHKRKGKRKTLTTMVSSKSSWWRHIVFFQAYLPLFKLFTMGFFFFWQTPLIKSFSPHICLADLFFVVVGQ